MRDRELIRAGIRFAVDSILAGAVLALVVMWLCLALATPGGMPQ